MSTTAANLSGLLTTNADINYYTQQSIFWNAKYEKNLAKLERHQKYETDWERAYDKVMDADKDVTFRKQSFQAGNENDAFRYAELVVEEYDEETLLELTDLDMEYESIKCMYDTMLEVLRAKQETQKTLTSESAQDTGLLQS